MSQHEKDRAKAFQAKVEEIKADPAGAAMWIRQLERLQSKLFDDLGEANEKLAEQASPRAYRESLFLRAQQRGLAPFEVSLDVQKLDAEIDRLSKALIDSLEREDLQNKKLDALRCRLIQAGLATQEEKDQWTPLD